MRKTAADFVRRLHSDESGVAIVTVIGIIAVMTILATTAFFFARQNMANVDRVNRQTIAFQAANSAVDVALARLQRNGFKEGDYPVTGTTSNNASYTASVSPIGNSEYLCIATGQDSEGATQTIKVKFFYLNMWNMNLASGTNNALGGGAVKGTTSVYGPFYVRGGVALGSNSKIENGPLFIRGGDLTISGSGIIGENAPVDVYVTGAYPEIGSKGFNARSVSQSVPDITLPPLDAEYLLKAYTSARTESVDNKQGYSDTGAPNLEADSMQDPDTYTTIDPPNGLLWTRRKAPGATAFYKIIGDDAGYAAIGQGTHGLTIGGTGSWGSVSGDGHYTLTTHDDFAFNDVTNVLYVEGTVFIDGPLRLAENITYAGNGQLVVNGDITIAEDFKPATGNGEADATHVVGLVTPENIICDSGDSNAKDPAGVPDVAGAFFCAKDWSMSRNVLVKGSVLAGSISFAHANQHLVTDPDLPDYLPRGMPGAEESILTKGTWVR